MYSNIYNRILFFIITILCFSTYVIATSSQHQVFGLTTQDNYNKGDDVTVQIFIDGQGPVNGGINGGGTFYFHAPEYIINKNQIQLEEVNVDCMDDNSCCFANGTFLLSFMNNFFLNLKSGMFKNACGSGTPLSNSMFEIISNTSIAPITIKFQLSKDALAGEHPLYLSYIYMNNNETYMSQYIVNIHIRAWYEKAVYQILLAVIAIITVITSILGISRESILIQRIRKKYIKAKHYKK